MGNLIEFFLSNKIEVLGTLFGILYVWLSVRQHIMTWLAGIITSLLFCKVFFDAKLYAQFGLQIFYVVLSIYGWWSWQYGKKDHQELHVSWTSRALWMRLFILNLVLSFVIYYITSIYTDDFLPFGDSMIASVSIVATWMLARKKIEQWFAWIIIDSISVFLYFYRGLYPTVILYLIYTIMAVIGFCEWRKETLYKDGIGK